MQKEDLLYYFSKIVELQQKTKSQDSLINKLQTRLDKFTIQRSKEADLPDSIDFEKD